MQNDCKNEWIKFIADNKVLKLWRRPIPLSKIYEDVNRVLLTIYEENNFTDIEVYAVLRIWDELKSQQEDTPAGHTNVNHQDWLNLLLDTPPDCFNHTAFTERLGNLLINILVICINEGVDIY